MNSIKSGSKNCIIYVRFFDRTYEDTIEKIDYFGDSVGLRFHEIFVVDNNLKDPLIAANADSRVTLVRGSNRFREFSGYYEGLLCVDKAGVDTQGVVVLLNDSWCRNWSIGLSGRLVFEGCLRLALKQTFVMPSDVVIDYRNRQVDVVSNSRFIILRVCSLGASINAFRDVISTADWNSSFPPKEDLEFWRLYNIFYGRNPHRAGDGKPLAVYIELALGKHPNSSLYPGTIGLGITYAIVRRLVRERR